MEVKKPVTDLIKVNRANKTFKATELLENNTIENLKAELGAIPPQLQFILSKIKEGKTTRLALLSAMHKGLKEGEFVTDQTPETVLSFYQGVMVNNSLIEPFEVPEGGFCAGIINAEDWTEKYVVKEKTPKEPKEPKERKGRKKAKKDVQYVQNEEGELIPEETVSPETEHVA